MNYIILAPYARKPDMNIINPKNFPAEWWEELVIKLQEKNYKIYQVGIDGDYPVADNITMLLNVNLYDDTFLKLLRESVTFISVDTFLPHFAAYNNIWGIVLWVVTDPLIYGYEQNKNLLKSRGTLAPDQFGSEKTYLKNGDKYYIAVEDVLEVIYEHN